MQGVGVLRAQVAGVSGRIRERLGIGAGTQILSQFLTGRVLVHGVNHDAVAAVVYLERDLPSLHDRDFLGRQVMQLVGARIRRTADSTGLKAWRRTYRRQRQDTEIDCRAFDRGLGFAAVAMSLL